MKKIAKEFRDFINRGNVIDMAVGVVMATAFGTITTTLVNNVIMPLIGLLIGGFDLSKLNIVLKPEVVDAAGTVTKEAVTLGLGSFLTAIINFLIIAIVIFFVVKGINKLQNLKKKPEEAPAAPTTKKCPFCCTEIAIEATRCPNCTSELPKLPEE